MCRFFTLLLAFSTHALHVAPGHGPIEGRTPSGPISVQARDLSLSTTDVDLALVQPFEPWPGYFQGKGSSSSRSLDQSVQKRSLDSDAICRGVRRPSGGTTDWQPHRAGCVPRDPNKQKFLVDCQIPAAAGRSQLDITDQEGYCKANTTCFEFHAQRETGDTYADINCQNTDVARQWIINAGEREAKDGICSPLYVNKGQTKQDLKLSLQTNVLDYGKFYYVSPSEVFYKMDGKRVGDSRAYNGIVGSGILSVPWGSVVEACVTPGDGQILVGFVGLTAMQVVN